MESRIAKTIDFLQRRAFPLLPNIKGGGGENTWEHRASKRKMKTTPLSSFVQEQITHYSPFTSIISSRPISTYDITLPTPSLPNLIPIKPLNWGHQRADPNTYITLFFEHWVLNTSDSAKPETTRTKTIPSLFMPIHSLFLKSIVK